MSDDDINKAVEDAEKFAEEDKKRREEVDLRNGADQLVFQTEKILTDDADKFEEADKNELQSKVDALKEALKGDDIEAIKAKQEELQTKFYEVSEKLYQAAAQANPEAAAAAAAAAGAAPGADAGADDAQDVEFTDVD